MVMHIDAATLLSPPVEAPLRLAETQFDILFLLQTFIFWAFQNGSNFLEELKHLGYLLGIHNYGWEKPLRQF